MHAILGASEHCIALHASDLCVALVALDATVHIQGPTAERRVPLTEFYVLPGERPDVENVLDHGELITAIDIPLLPLGARSGYLKVRDRASYEFALVSVAAALVIVERRRSWTRGWRSAGSARSRGGRARPRPSCAAPLPTRACSRPRRAPRSPTPSRSRAPRSRCRSPSGRSSGSWRT